MRWERRKPLWPIVAALGLLLVLAIAAPRSWQNYPSRQLPRVAEPQIDLPVPSALKPATTEPVLSQPPVASRIEEPLPIRREYDFGTLLKVRDKLLVLFNQLPASPPLATHPAETTQPADSPVRQIPPIRVTSESDRLAMVMPRLPTNRREQAPALAGQTLSVEIKSVETTNDEVANFAAILLEASQSHKSTKSTRAIEPRLAMRPTMAPKPIVTSKPIEISVPVKSSIVEQGDEVIAPLSVEPAPLRHRPLALVKQLEDFSASSPGAVWSQQVLAQIRLLTEKNSAERPDTMETMNRLDQLTAIGIHKSGEVTNPTFDIEWRQAAQALARRLVLWQILLDPQQPLDSQPNISAITTMLPILNEVAELLEKEHNGNDWREYLLLDRLAATLSEGISSPALVRAKLAQKVLSRMADPGLTESQRDFLATRPLVELHQTLRIWAAGKVNLETLTALVERYESARETRYAAVIAQLQQRLKWSEDPQLQALAAHLDQHYRGANMRLAMSDDLLNRMVPKQQPTVTPVQTRIAGVKVHGRARTTTQVHVRLLPDPNAWHFGLEATGKIYSDTRSDTWPARIRNAAKMQYQGRKEIAIDKQGLHVSRAQATAQGRNELIDVDSQLDPIPLVGHLLRNMARQKHKKSRPTALRQAKANVVRTVKQRMDTTLDQKLELFEQKFRDMVLAPIEELALLAEPLDMHTTKHRAIMQLRLANPGQLAAHTLRPLAPSDSVLSLQMHETALNNAMMGLELNGRRMTMLELFDYLSERFGQPDATPPEDLPHRAVIQFAKRDALRVQCDGDRLELVLSVAELAHRRDKIKNFQIHVHFRPLVSGLSVKLVRDGTLQFSGRRLKTGPRIVLHSIMGKLLVQGQEINLVNAKLMLDPRFAGLMVTQLVIEEGWIGLALGPASPRRTAWRAPTPAVLVTPFVR